MKLRLRSLETKETLRMEVPTPCSLQEFKDLISQRISSSSSSAVHISLNRKNELYSSSPEQDSLQSLGITSGDLIFFTLNPNGFSSGTPIAQHQTHQEPRSNDPQDSKETPIPKQQITDSEAKVGSILDFNTHNEKTLDLNTQKEESLDLDSQIGENQEYMDVDDDGPVVEAGKSFSVPGFLRKVFTQELGDDGGRDHKLLVIAIHAVLLESGFIGFDPVSNIEVHGFQFPNEWPSSAFRMSLRYTLPEMIGQINGSVNGIDTVVLKFQSLGKFFNVYGSLANGSGTHWVRLDEHSLVPFLNIVWANCGSVDEIGGQNGISSTTPEREVFNLWRSLKDRLALPLLIDLCEKTGLELPPCFMRLPSDLKLKILESLPGVDIAKVACVCSELRYLASSDDLWKQKFGEQFGDAVRLEGGGHWKDKFGKNWEWRKSRRRRMTVRGNRGIYRRDPNPFLGLPFPRVIGGPHDIWPGLVGNHFSHRQPGRGYPRSHCRNHIPHCNLGGPDA
ncbi:unnamed protein product [Ilex paraguariensis]|uniref:F-box domain-containing protein n=1 Tax=Ilex paraguariensis TaxID=185542 RepID=A0ABC8RJL2_9AQUA